MNRFKLNQRFFNSARNFITSRSSIIGFKTQSQMLTILPLITLIGAGAPL